VLLTCNTIFEYLFQYLTMKIIPGVLSYKYPNMHTCNNYSLL